MSDVSRVISCPVCGTEVPVRKNKNGKPGFYCKGCKVQVQSSGGKSQEFINANSRPAVIAATQEDNGHGLEEVVAGGKDNGEGNGGAAEPAPERKRSFLDRFLNGDGE